MDSHTLAPAADSLAPPHFDNSYARLPERFFARLTPQGAPAPRLVRVNEGLAAELGLDAAWLASPAGLAMLAGTPCPRLGSRCAGYPGISSGI